MRILFFTQENCNACIQQDEQLKTYASSIPIQKVELEKDRDIFVEFGINQTPMLVMLDGNTEVKRTVMKFGDELKEWARV